MKDYLIKLFGEFGSGSISKRRSAKPNFPRKIERLILFAGPLGSGKTTFLKNPEHYLCEKSLPKTLSDFFDLAKEHHNIMASKVSYNQSLSLSLCLHVDLTYPFRAVKFKRSNRSDFLQSITSRAYREWPKLSFYLSQAARIDIVTLFVSREENFRRWIISRELGRNDAGINVRMAAIIGDSSNRSEIHRKVYRAWNDFTQMLTPQSMNVIDGNSKMDYRFMTDQEFFSEIIKR